MAPMAIATLNPATGETLRSFDPHSPDEVSAAIATAHATFQTWRTTSFEERAALMNRAADLLDEDNESIARIMTLEMGKTLKSARAEAAKCAKAMRWYAEHAERLLADEPAEGVGGRRLAGVLPLRPARGRARGHAVELPAVAGDPVRRPGADGGQRRPAQARLERAADARSTWRTCSAGPASPRAASRPC